MISAFGVDHGDIEKGLFSAIGGGIGGKLASAGSGLARSGARASNYGRRMQAGKVGMNGAKAGSQNAMNIGRGMQAGGRMRARTGLAMGKVGQGMTARPGLAGAAVAGTGAAGIGGGAALLNNRRQ